MNRITFSVLLFQGAPEAQRGLFKLINQNNLSKTENTRAHRAVQSLEMFHICKNSVLLSNIATLGRD